MAQFSGGGNATPDKVLENWTFSNDDGEQIGTLPDHGSVVFIPKMTAQNIPDGAYIDAIIEAASGGNALASEIIAGKKATIDTGQITGTMVNRGALNITPSASAQTVQPGYYSGGTVAAIPTGYVRYAYGTFTIGPSGAWKFTVSGLSFTPSVVYLEHDNSPVAQGAIVLSFYSGRSFIVYAGAAKDTREIYVTRQSGGFIVDASAVSGWFLGDLIWRYRAFEYLI